MTGLDLGFVLNVDEIPVPMGMEVIGVGIGISTGIDSVVSSPIAIPIPIIQTLVLFSKKKGIS
jgi:hypothetical protein